MLTSVKLVDGDREMILLPRQDQGVHFQELDAPFPAVRASTEDRTDDDGEDDTTSLHGARSCSIELLVTQQARTIEDELTRFLHPRSRPYLVVADDEWAQARRLRLRVAQWSAPLTVELPRAARRIQAQWQAPDGVWEAADLVTETISADMPGTAGRIYPRTYPYAYPATLAAGASVIVNVGGTPSHYTARLYGPCIGPRLTNETTGETIAFTAGLTLAAGEYVEISTRDRTAYLNGHSALSRLNVIDFDVTSWWRIEPGEQQVRYAPAVVFAGAAAVIDYRPAWL